MFFGQINASATLPIHVRMHLMNSKFLVSCTLPYIACLFLPYKWRLSFPSKKRATKSRSRNWNVKPHSRCHACVTESIPVWRLASY